MSLVTAFSTYRGRTTGAVEQDKGREKSKEQETGRGQKSGLHFPAPH